MTKKLSKADRPAR